METERERNIRKIYAALGVEPWEPPKPVLAVKKKRKARAPKRSKRLPTSGPGRK